MRFVHGIIAQVTALKKLKKKGKKSAYSMPLPVYWQSLYCSAMLTPQHYTTIAE